MKVLILGAQGNMGRRYSLIVEKLGHTALELDIQQFAGWMSYGKMLRDCLSNTDHVIIATPTRTHAQVIHEVIDNSPHGVDILCEKPIATGVKELEGLYYAAALRDSLLYCVNQYAHLPESDMFETTSGDTVYDYYRHGPDGLHWDCFQLYALARGNVHIDEKSVIWKCYINGIPIDLRNMDRAYIYMIEDFLGPKRRMWGKEIVMKTTQKIVELLSR